MREPRFLTPVSGCRESRGRCFHPGGRMTTTDLPATMPAAVLKGLRHVEVEDRPLPTLGPREVLLEISHCGICGSDLHFMVEWEGAAKPGAIEGHEYSGTVVALGKRRRGLEDRRRGRRRSVAALRGLRVLPRRPAVAVPRAGQGRRGRQRVAGSLRAVQGGERRRDAAGARRAVVAARRAGRADGRRAARHHPFGWGATRRALPRDRRRADRVPLGRGAEGRGRRRHRRERAPRRSARAVRAPRCAHRRPVGARPPDDAARSGRRAVRRRARVLRKPRSHGSRARAAEARRNARARRSRDAPAAVRQQPHPAERADDHRRVRLRRRRLPARARAARVGSRAARRARRARRRAARRVCSTPRSVCTRAGSRRR